MYEIRPESIKTFIEDRSIRLPRFQRKQTWNEKKNFALTISIFKGFPLGVVVINKEIVNRQTTKWLLDGRQRKNALMSILNDPEMIYLWGKKFIGFRNSDQPYEIEEKFWIKIEEYLGREDDSKEDENDTILDEEPEESNEPIEFETETDPIPQLSSKNRYRGDLDLLLEIILICHKKTRKNSGFTLPFDFTDFINNLDYVENQNGYKKLNSKKLKTWMNEYLNYCKDNDLSFLDNNHFYEYLKKRYFIQDKNLRLKEIINRNWLKIVKRFEILDLIETKIQETKIGFIELSGTDASDAQTIFKIINSEGTPLKAVEILSAKPSWNIKINNPSENFIQNVDLLYNIIGATGHEGVVRWDMAATLMNRLNHIDFIFKDLNYDISTEFDKKITLGFKLLSAVFEEGISKNHIDSLSENNNINWETDIDQLINDFNTIGKLLSNDSFYKYLMSWKTNLMDLTSDAISINFMIITYLDWKRKGEPIGNNSSVKMFIKNSMILFDSLIYAYIAKQWRGSSDSRVSENIKELNSKPALFEPMQQQKWKDLIEEIIEKHSANDDPLNKNKPDPLLRPILYYFYTLKNQAGPDNIGVTIDIDHIMPKTLIETSTISNKDMKMHNLFNLALLPKKDNISKSNKKLIEINDPWLIDQIEKYTSITKTDFIKYSDIQNIDELQIYRKEEFLRVFTEVRANIFIN